MKQRLLLLLLAVISTGAFAQTPKSVITAGDVTVPLYDFNNLEPLLNRSNDTLYIYNFWATWCIPCVEEMPAFLQLDSAMHEHPVRLVLVSLDMRSKIESNLVPFIRKYRIKAPVLVLADPDANAWIDRVSPEWSGTIPATLFVYREKRIFMEQSFTYAELYQTVLDLRLE